MREARMTQHRNITYPEGMTLLEISAHQDIRTCR